MPRVIVKAARGVDLYLEWSTVVDAPTRVGSRAELLDESAKEEDPYERNEPDAFDRADEKGSSALGGWEFGWWEDDGFIVQNFWGNAPPSLYLPREKLLAFALALEREDPDPLAGLARELMDDE